MMRRDSLLMVGILVFAGLQLPACKHSPASAKGHAERPAQVKRVEGAAFSTVTLTEKAVQRLGPKTDQDREEKVIRQNQTRGSRKDGPYSSVIYDTQCQTWIYTTQRD